eukprot:13516453-Alexandrium_andersonii.AAC.1
MGARVCCTQRGAQVHARAATPGRVHLAAGMAAELTSAAAAVAAGMCAIALPAAAGHGHVPFHRRAIAARVRPMPRAL